LFIACGERMRPERPGELALCTLNGTTSQRSMRLEERGFWSLAAARHASTIAWSGGACNVSAWDITHQRPKSFRQTAASLAVALSDDGSTLAAAASRSIRVWSVDRGQERAMLEAHRGLVRSLAFSPCGRLLASGGQDQSVRIWHVAETGVRPGPVYQWAIGAIHALAFSPDGLTAAAAGDSGDILIWDVED
jgi:WD40 repeat protein